MDYLIYLLLAFTLFVVLILLLGAITASGRKIRHRLSEIKAIEEPEEDEMKKPFVERALLPIYDGMFKFLERLTPKNIKDFYQEIILKAGISDKYTPIRILLNQFLLAAVITSTLAVLWRATGTSMNWPMLSMIAVLAFFYPIVHFSTMATKRQIQIKKSLPDVLDMLYISVEAGLSFDSAMKKTASKMKGPLTQEINRAMDEITKGREREESLRSIGLRSQVEDVSSFITAVIQSELLGSNIANMLRIQSTTMREKRRQQAEEEAMRIPLKMLFPMIFLMFPALFVIILGPALINIYRTLSGF